MKVIRGLLTFIVCFIFVFVIVGFTIIFNVRNIVSNQVIGEIAKQELIKDATDGISDSIEPEDMEEIQEYADTINEMLGSNDVQEIIDAVLSEYMKYAEDDDYEVSEETLDLIINYCAENKDKIEELSNSEFDIEEITSEESRENLREAFNEGFSEVTTELDDNAKTVIKAVDLLTSSKTKTYAAFVVLGFILVLAVLSFSLYKWLNPCGVSFITAGVIVVLLFAGLSGVVTLIKSQAELDFSINVNTVLYSGLIEIAAGVAMLVICSKIKKSAEKEEKPVVTVESNRSGEQVEDAISTEETNTETTEDSNPIDDNNE